MPMCERSSLLTIPHVLGGIIAMSLNLRGVSVENGLRGPANWGKQLPKDGPESRHDMGIFKAGSCDQQVKCTPALARPPPTRTPRPNHARTRIMARELKRQARVAHGLEWLLRPAACVSRCTRGTEHKAGQVSQAELHSRRDPPTPWHAHTDAHRRAHTP